MFKPVDIHFFRDRDDNPRASLSTVRGKTRGVLLTYEQHRQLASIVESIEAQLRREGE